MPKHSDDLNLAVIAARFVRRLNDRPILDVIAALKTYHDTVRPLDLERMAETPRDFDIVHDVVGIYRYNNDRTEVMHRETFVPRFAVRQGRVA
jgi:hypothetical protein